MVLIGFQTLYIEADMPSASSNRPLNISMVINANRGIVMFANETESPVPICQVDFQGIFGEGSKIIDEILQKMKDKNWSERDIFAVNMALEESITNAIEHGNRCDPQKKIHVRYSIQDNKVFISVRDEGPGFDSRIIPDPRVKENMNKPSGRGVLLIHGFMTKVWFNSCGNELFMEKDRSES